MTPAPRGYRPCVGILLLNPAGGIFVGERIDTPGAWQMPQGGINEGESVKNAGFRELEEETGISMFSFLGISTTWRCYELPQTLSRETWHGKYKGQAQLWLALHFNGENNNIKLPTLDAEFRDWKWTDPVTLLNEIVDFKRAVYRDVLEEFASFIGS
ncbi:MAG: RNA pyrophosphohydrolase [Pseudomonadota bacterium]|nr:RNA pyrophosphohydrolase [Pseudomonadota bacterium]